MNPKEREESIISDMCVGLGKVTRREELRRKKEEERKAQVRKELQIKIEARKTLRLSTPYPQFCRHPEKCIGLGCCPRDPCCAD